MTENSFEPNGKSTLEKVEETLFNKSSYIIELKKKFDQIEITNGGELYSIWFYTGCGKARYGEARIKGSELVLYKERYWNDHEILHDEIERISLT